MSCLAKLSPRCKMPTRTPTESTEPTNSRYTIIMGMYKTSFGPNWAHQMRQSMAYFAKAAGVMAPTKANMRAAAISPLIPFER
eukprot:1726836-Alexandrium_andersonii.AAC.1